MQSKRSQPAAVRQLASSEPSRKYWHQYAIVQSRYVFVPLDETCMQKNMVAGASACGGARRRVRGAGRVWLGRHTACGHADTLPDYIVLKKDTFVLSYEQTLND